MGCPKNEPTLRVVSTERQDSAGANVHTSGEPHHVEQFVDPNRLSDAALELLLGAPDKASEMRRSFLDILDSGRWSRGIAS